MEHFLSKVSIEVFLRIQVHRRSDRLRKSWDGESSNNDKTGCMLHLPDHCAADHHVGELTTLSGTDQFLILRSSMELPRGIR